MIQEKKEKFLQLKVNYNNKVKIALIDYGSGNLQSAYKALQLAASYNKKNKIFITSKSKDLLKADKIVLPGVGSFSDCMKGLKSISGMITISNVELYKFQISNKHYDSFIKLLLRSYTNLFSSLTIIDENKIAEKFKLDSRKSCKIKKKKEN